MTPRRSVLVGLSDREFRGHRLGERLAGWVDEQGFEPAVTTDGRESIAWLRERGFAASLLDACLTADTGEQVWRTVRPVLGRRLVLMAREPRNDIWFEALRAGVGALLALPPRRSAVRAALRAATRTMPARALGGSGPHEPTVEGMP